MKYNSEKNQQIKGKLVGREIIQNATELISEVQEKSEVLSMEFVDLFYSQPDYDGAKEDHIYELPEEEIRELTKEYGVDDLDDVDAEEFCNIENLDPHWCEPFEFWIVTDYFGEKLKEKGEIVEDFLGFTIWGRQCSGQAILLDGVVSEIAKDMEILEGMKNEW